MLATAPQIQTPAAAPHQAPRLMDRVRETLRLHRYALSTERTYCHWIKRFIFFHNKRHPSEMGAAEVEAFLTHLATAENVSASTQNQAMHAVLYLYKNVLGVDLLLSKPLANAISLMLGPILANEARVSYWNLQEHHLCTPHTLRGLSELVGAPFESVSHPAPTPTKAAQAKTKGAPKAAPAADQTPAKKPAAKKAKAKADPAPASPANEAAAPPKATERPAWPFPTGAQA